MEKRINLWRLRKKRGLTAQELSDKTDVPAKVIYELENGLKRADIKHVMALARYFGVTIKYLMRVSERGDYQ